MTTFRVATAASFEYSFPAGKTALVVIDRQRDFVEPGGFGASFGNDVTRLHPAIVPSAALLAAWRGRAWPIVHTHEAHLADLVIRKPGKGMFWSTRLNEILHAQGVTHLVFTGVTIEVCVQTSMREANDRGYACRLVEDGTESYFPEFKAATLAMIAAQGGIVGWHASSQAPLGAIQRVG